MALFRNRVASLILLRSHFQPLSRSLSSASSEEREADLSPSLSSNEFPVVADILSSGAKEIVEPETVPSWKLPSMMNQMFTLDITSQIGSCMPLSMMRIGTQIHNIEMRPGQGGKLVRAAGTSAKILTVPNRSTRFCEIKLPSGVTKQIDTRCRATIGMVSNPGHRSKKLRKAGQSRWLGRRPVVRGVAMNPVDHPHGGGEGRSKSSGSHGRVSVSPWGKPTKSGYKTARPKRRI